MDLDIEALRHIEEQRDKLSWSTLQRHFKEELDNLEFFSVAQVEGYLEFYQSLFVPAKGTTIIKSVVVTRKMQVSLSIYGNKLNIESNLTQWSQLRSILNGELDGCPLEPSYAIFKSVELLESVDWDCDLENEASEGDNLKTGLALRMKVLVDQLKNFLSTGGGLNYSRETLLMSFILQSLSTSSYKALLHHFSLPSIRTLQRLSQKFDSSDNRKFFTSLMNGVPSDQPYFTLIIDEMKLKEEVRLSNGKLFGLTSEGGVDAVARSVQTFMVQSQSCGVKEVVRMVPVSRQTSAQLVEQVFDVIRELSGLAIVVTVIGTDNSQLNVSMQRLLTSCTGGKLNRCFPHPHIPNHRIFTTYDAVHLYKNIRNNWLGAEDLVFCVPKWEEVVDSFSLKEQGCDISSYVHRTEVASFQVVRNLFNRETPQLIRSAFKLNTRTVYVNGFDKQNVSLVDNLFHASTIAALKSCGQMETASFLKVIRSWFDIMNCRSKFQGARALNDFNKPFERDSLNNDTKLLFLRQFLHYLEVWERLPGSENHRLTARTASALRQSIDVTLSFVPYIFKKCSSLKYFLSGNLQSDCIENFFGAVRTVSGRNYTPTDLEAKLAFKKLRNRHCVKFVISGQESQHVERDIKLNQDGLKRFLMSQDIDFDFEEAELSCEPALCADISDFLPILERNFLSRSIQLNPDSTHYITGAGVCSTLKKIGCKSCQDKLQVSKGASIGEVLQLTKFPNIF